MSYRILAAALCAALLCACSSNAASTLPQPQSPASHPRFALVPAAGGSPIQHVIVVIQENRTFDNMFNGFPGADTVTRGRNHRGKLVTLQPQGLEWEYDPSHAHTSLVTEYDNGKMDGFSLDRCDSDPLNFSGGCTPPPNFTYSYVPKGEVQWLWILGGEYAFAGKGYGIADRMFSSRQVPSFPGHQYLIAGQSVASGDPIGPGERTLHGIWGCDAPKAVRVEQFGKTYTSPLTKGYPCYDYQTIGDLMDAKGVSWKYYTGLPRTTDGDINGYDAIKHIRFGADWSTKVVWPMTEIFSDIANNTLPQVSFVTPPFAASDHGATLSAGGPAWVMSLYVALTENRKLYGNTAMLVTWDDSGGWYDHVAPPSDSFGPLGFRVPLLVISPYARQKVSHAQHDFGSILHYIERNWNLGSLGQRDMFADDLSDMFNYKQKPIPPIANFGGFNRRAFEHKYTRAYWDSLAKDPRPVDTDQ
ncbi:MAG TPA: alkaline phosphatase family protein [Candidatus Baltobacteraceae bacterium]|nr:alkaline phosphatase family protein [Candidatus Baltobacteraceae bacterium]